jgi:ATP-binding cassette subfamily B protein
MANSYFEEEEFTTQFNGGTLRRILALTRPHWTWVAGFLVLIAIVSLLDGYFTFLSKQIIDQGILAGDQAALTRLITVYGGLILVQAVCVLGFILLVAVLGERVQYDLRQKMFKHLQELSISYFDRTPVGWIMTRVTSDSERIAQLVTWGTLDSAWAVLNVCTAMAFMLVINWRLALIVAGIIPLLLIVAIQFKTRILVQYRKVRKFNSKLTGAYNETISGVRVVKALCREEENLREFSVLATDMYGASFRAAWLSALFLPVVQIISALAVGAIIYYSGRSMAQATLAGVLGGMTIGGVQAFIGYVTSIMWPISDLARVYADLQHSIASAERAFSLVDAQPDVVDRPGAIDPGTIHGEVEFEHVDFYYEAGKPVLADFNLKVRPGETIALVGPTGGGKSTIVNLICRSMSRRRA